MKQARDLFRAMTLAFKAHPWHGIHIGEEAPEVVAAFIEITPSDTVKYEIDKPSGYLKVDRPQKFSNVVPALYGFIPRTYCMEQVGEFCMKKTGRTGIVGDGDPLDVVVLTEREITHGDLVVQAVPIGGLRMIDANEADDKIIAILKQDEVYGHWKDIAELPPAFVNRLRHYFLTYKQPPGGSQPVEITHAYGRQEALEVIRAAQADYQNHFGDPEMQLEQTLINLMSGE